MTAEWIKRRKAEKDKQRLDAELLIARNRLAKQTFKVEGPAYWDALLPELESQCEGADEIGFQAKAYSIENPHCESEKTYRLDVQANGTWPESAYTLLVYSLGSSQINVTGDIAKLTKLNLVITEDGIRTVSNLDTRLRSVSSLAEYLLESLVGVIEKALRV